MTFALKRLNLEHMDRAAVIHRASFDERLPWLTGLHSPAEDRAYFRNQVFTQTDVWGALDADIIGFIAFRQGWVDQLYVMPGRQAEGVGSALLDVAQASSSTLDLWTFQSNTLARRFYENRGFVVVEETDGSRNEEREPDLRYRWQRAPLQGRNGG